MRICVFWLVGVASLLGCAETARPPVPRQVWQAELIRPDGEVQTRLDVLSHGRPSIYQERGGQTTLVPWRSPGRHGEPALEAPTGWAIVVSRK